MLHVHRESDRMEGCRGSRKSLEERRHWAGSLRLFAGWRKREGRPTKGWLKQKRKESAVKAYGVLEGRPVNKRTVWAEPSVAGDDDGETGQHKTYRHADFRLKDPQQERVEF